MNHVTFTLGSSASFSPQIQIFVHNFYLILLTYFEPLRIVLINMVTILMVPAKMTSLVLLKIKVF